jgi:hypothetical protein
MRARRTKSSLLLRRLVAPLAGAVSFLAYAGLPAAATSVPSLQNAYAQAQTWFDQGEGPANPPGCTPAGTSTISFAGTSNLFGGLYGSLITVNGSVSVGAQNHSVDLTNDPGYGFPANYGDVSNVTGTFSMSTPGGSTRVTGTFNGTGPPGLLNPGNIASCYGGSGDVFGYTGLTGGALTALHTGFRYLATIDGQSVTGVGILAGTQVCFHRDPTHEEGCSSNMTLGFPYPSVAPDNTPPAMNITVTPNPVLQNDGSATAAANASDPESGILYESCDPVDTSQVGTFGVFCRAANNAGLESIGVTSYQVLSSATPPDTVIDTAPTGTVKATSASIDFHSDPSGATFQCSVDHQSAATCTSPLTLSGLADGAHHVDVTAIDESSNADPTPASADWTVDATKPTVALTFPSSGATVGQKEWTLSGCAQVGLCGTAGDAGSGVASVRVSIGTGTGSAARYWNGTGFTATHPTLVLATGTTSWSLAFPFANFPATSSYLICVQADDAVHNANLDCKSVNINTTRGFFVADPTTLPIRNGATATKLADGSVLFAGGSSNGADQLNTAERFFPATGQWVPTQPMTEGRNVASAVLLPSGKVLVAAGNTGTWSKTASLYDPATNAWTTTGSLFSPRARGDMFVLANGKVLMAAGGAAIAEIYDPAAGTWAKTGALKTNRDYDAAVLLPTGKVMVIGGEVASKATNTAEIYDPATGKWAAAANMATARALPTATVLSSGKVLVTGGFLYGTTGASLASAEVYDPTTNKWTTVAPMSLARFSATAQLLADGTVFVAGGSQGAAARTATTEVYDPVSNKWRASGSMTIARSGATVTPMPNGKLLIRGGAAAGTAEFYIP